MRQQEDRRSVRGRKGMLAEMKEMFVLPPTIELTRNVQAAVQGSRGILEYTDERIRVSLEGLEVCFYGTELSIRSLDQDSLEIKGRIERVEYR